MRFGALIRPLRAGDKGLAVNRIRCPRTMTVRSDAFGDGQSMPLRSSADGEGAAPGLFWEGVPAGAVELVLVVQDPDVPLPRPIVHAVVTRIDPAAPGLPQGAWERIGTHGLNTFRKPSYIAPAPIPGHGAHRYVFQLFALDRRTRLAKPPGLSALIGAISGSAMASGVLVGRYERV